VLIGAIISGFTMAFVSSVAPTGPIALLVIERGLSRRYREGRALAIGASLPEGAYAALGAFGVTALFMRFPNIELGTRIASVVVLLALGAYFLRYDAAPATVTTKDPASDSKQSGRRAFVLGATIALANPLLVVTWSTSIALLLSLSGFRFSVSDRVVFAASVPLGIVAWFSLFLAILRRNEGRVTMQIAARVLRVAGALLIVAALFFGASLVSRALVR
jgi:threonine/homoserine/homoserine lactone efflux protein